MIIVTIIIVVSVLQLFTAPQSVCIQALYFQMTITMALGFVLAWTPYAILSFYYFLEKSTEVPSFISVAATQLAKSSNFYNPIIYFISIKRFRQDVKEVKQTLGMPWDPARYCLEFWIMGLLRDTQMFGNVHVSVPIEVLWDMGQVYCKIFEIVLLCQIA